MRSFISFIFASGILAVAYIVTFGTPPWLAEMTGETTQTEATSAGDAAGARGAGRGGRGGRSGATSVVTTALELRPYDSVITAIGTARALRSVTVVSESSGTVTETHLDANRDVAEGDVLLRFDARAEALNLEIATAELEQAKETTARYERLHANGSATVTDVSLSDARMAQRLAEAAVGLAELAVEEKTVRAPISGRLGLSEIGVGDALSANAEIATIDQAETLVVEFELPERAIGMLAPGKEVSAMTTTLTGRIFTATVTSFDSRIDDVTRSVTVKARIDNSEGLLWPGMTFGVRLTQESAPMAALPSTAITWSRSGSSVWIDADGKAAAVPVTILYRQDDTVWLDAEIAVGTRVVTEGAQKLRDGAQITSPGARSEGGARPDGAGRGEGGGRPEGGAGPEGIERPQPSAELTQDQPAQEPS